MTIGIRSLDWLAHNAQRSYPLAADATKLDLTGSFLLPSDFIVNLYISIPWGINVQPGKFFIRKVSAYSTGFAVVIGYDAVGGAVNVAAAQIPRAAHTGDTTYSLTGIGDFVTITGYIVIGELANIDLQPSGDFEFDLEGGRLETDVVRPNIKGVTTIQAQNGVELSNKLDGNVIFRAGPNMRITTQILVGHDPVIIFDAIDGVGLTEDCICDTAQDLPVKTLQMVTPDSQGNINILGNDCFQIVPGNNALVIKDICSEPCCGCKELEAVTSQLEAFGSKATTLENFLVSLEARVTTMDNIVLGSRLGDRGCVPGPDCN